MSVYQLVCVVGGLPTAAAFRCFLPGQALPEKCAASLKYDQS